MAEITIRVSDRALRGALVGLGAIFLAWGTFHLWSSGVLRPKYQIQMFVPEAEGIRVGASVRLDGMPVGRVGKVDPAGNSADSSRRIDVELRIEKRFQNMIRDDSKAVLLTDGLLGDRYVNIVRGFAGPPITPGGEIRAVPIKETTLTDFVDAIQKTADCKNEEKNVRDSKSPIVAKKSASAE